MRFRLTSRSMALDDLELYKFEFSEIFSGFRRFRMQQQLNDNDNVVSSSNWSNFWHALASRGFVSDSWAFLFVSGLSTSWHSRPSWQAAADGDEDTVADAGAAAVTERAVSSASCRSRRRSTSAAAAVAETGRATWSKRPPGSTTRARCVVRRNRTRTVSGCHAGRTDLRYRTWHPSTQPIGPLCVLLCARASPIYNIRDNVAHDITWVKSGSSAQRQSREMRIWSLTYVTTGNHWNSLPDSFKYSSLSLSRFQNHLKTFSFLVTNAITLSGHWAMRRYINLNFTSVAMS